MKSFFRSCACAAGCFGISVAFVLFVLVVFTAPQLAALMAIAQMVL